MSSSRLSRREAKRLFEDNLELIDEILAMIGRRYGLSSDEAADFTSWAKLRLIESDYAAFTKFEGRSALPTYLTVVLKYLFRDYRHSRWGRWRPSALATRMGEAAVQLESLIQRDGFSTQEAVRMLQENHGMNVSEADLERLAASLPQRQRPVHMTPDPDREVATQRTDETAVANKELRPLADRVQRELIHAMRSLSSQERRILQLRFEKGLKLVEIAELLGLDQRATYHASHRALLTLRRCFQRAGISSEMVAEMMGWRDLDIDLEEAFADDVERKNGTA